MKRDFGILNDDLGIIDNASFNCKKRSLGRVVPKTGGRWCSICGTYDEWWSSRFIFLTVKRFL